MRTDEITRRMYSIINGRYIDHRKTLEFGAGSLSGQFSGLETIMHPYGLNIDFHRLERIVERSRLD